MSAFLEKNKGLKLSMKPNIRGEWIVTPHDVKVMDKLASTKDVHLQRLSSAQKLTKAVVLGPPPQIPEDDLTRLCNIASAEKLKNREGYSTRTILCTFSGTVPEYVDLGPFGKYRTRPYVPEPMRCYNCQRYGHHKSQCQQGHKCAVCSSRHETSVCINKHKNGQETKAKCPNCYQEHHAWYRRCPTRLEKIHMTAPAPSAKKTPQPAAASRTAPWIKIDYVKPKPAPQPPQPATYKKPIYIEMDDLHLALQKFVTILSHVDPMLRC